jgi:hypothetical protein
MSLKSSTFPLDAHRGGAADEAAKTKQRLLTRHHGEIERVVADAKSYWSEYRRKLGAIHDKGLRDRAKR